MRHKITSRMIDLDDACSRWRKQNIGQPRSMGSKDDLGIGERAHQIVDRHAGEVQAFEASLGEPIRDSILVKNESPRASPREIKMAAPTASDPALDQRVERQGIDRFHQEPQIYPAAIMTHTHIPRERSRRHEGILDTDRPVRGHQDQILIRDSGQPEERLAPIIQRIGNQDRHPLSQQTPGSKHSQHHVAQKNRGPGREVETECRAGDVQFRRLVMQNQALIREYLFAASEGPSGQQQPGFQRVGTDHRGMGLGHQADLVRSVKGVPHSADISMDFQLDRRPAGSDIQDRFFAAHNRRDVGRLQGGVQPSGGSACLAQDLVTEWAEKLIKQSLSPQ